VIAKSNQHRITLAAVIVGLIFLTISIARLAPQNANSLLTGRWLMFVNDEPNPLRILEFSSRGSVTAYKLDGVTLDQVPGYEATWTVKGGIIEERGSPPKPVATTTKALVSSFFSSKREDPNEVTRLAYAAEDDSTLHLVLLDPRLQHRLTLRRVASQPSP
jgi:hypothetical protein